MSIAILRVMALWPVALLAIPVVGLAAPATAEQSLSWPTESPPRRDHDLPDAPVPWTKGVDGKKMTVVAAARAATTVALPPAPPPAGVSKASDKPDERNEGHPASAVSKPTKSEEATAPLPPAPPAVSSNAATKADEKAKSSDKAKAAEPDTKSEEPRVKLPPAPPAGSMKPETKSEQPTVTLPPAPPVASSKPETKSEEQPVKLPPAPPAGSMKPETKPEQPAVRLPPAPPVASSKPETKSEEPPVKLPPAPPAGSMKPETKSEQPAVTLPPAPPAGSTTSKVKTAEAPAGLPPAPPAMGTSGAGPAPPPVAVPKSKSEVAGESRAGAAKEAGSRMPPVKGSQLPADQNMCVTCHGDTDLWDQKNRRLYISKDVLAEDVHWKRGVNCSDCHGGDPSASEVNHAHAKDEGFRSKLAEIRKYCTYCHAEQALDMVKSVHAKAGDREDRRGGALLGCDKCHGEVKHHLLPVKDPRSPVFLDHQVQTCGGCHEKDRLSYLTSAHGHGLVQSGLLVTASCSDCHGAHGIYRVADKRSTLHSANVAVTCGKCHRFIEDRLNRSVHGQGRGPGQQAARTAPGGKGREHPSCTSCHQGHTIARSAALAFRLQLPHLCGNCHAELSSQYAMSMHGELTELGFGPAAKCSDCHGAHEILAVSDPNSRLSPANRQATCGQCHPAIVWNALWFDPHADQNDPVRNPILYWVYHVLMTLLITTFTVFGLHSVAWLIRGLVEVLKHGRPRSLVPGAPAYVRFGPFHRRAHILLMVSFLGLAATGLPLKYSHTDWAKSLAFFLGGFNSTSTWHRLFGVLLLGCLVVYIVLMARHFREERRAGTGHRGILFDPDSPVPSWRDVKDILRMMRWFVGLGPKPTFDRWAYWEKFDFWGACADAIIIGVTGLILWFPNLFCSFLPGITLNIAKVIHSTQALLATGFVFAVHFFHAHLRPEKFPADMAILTGLVSEEEMREERPEFLRRMEQEGTLAELRTVVPSRRTLWLIRLGGWFAFGLGLALLLGILVAILGK